MEYQCYIATISKIGLTRNGVPITREAHWFLFSEGMCLVRVSTNSFTVSYGAKIVSVTGLSLYRNSIEKTFSTGLFAYQI